MELFKIGFVTIRLMDIIDISIVTFLFYKLYELLRGSLAIRILTALLMVFLFWKLVELLDMVLLKSILDEFLGLGAIALIVIFSAEIRRFLIIIGQNTILERLWRQLSFTTEEGESTVDEIVAAVEEIRGKGFGALIVITGRDTLEVVQATGDRIGAELSERLLVSIFHAGSPLHDGAVIIRGNSVAAARCVLPVSESHTIAPELGLRHRSAIGVSEQSDALVVIVSEERGEVSLAQEGKLERGVDMITLSERIRQHLQRPE